MLDELLPELYDRAHGRENARAVAWVLARHMSWSSMTTRPGHALICELTGVSLSTVRRVLHRLQEAGLLGVVEQGTTPQFSPMALAGAGNRAAVYVLTVPSRATTGYHALPPARSPVNESDAPTWSIPEGVDPDARASSAETGPLRGPDGAEGGKWPRTRAARSRSERLQLARRLQLEVPALRRLTDRAVRHLLRPWLLAGWTVAELQWALDHEPDGSERTWTTEVRKPGGWLVSRLRAYAVTPGVACSPPSVALRASESADRAAAEALAAEHAAQRAQRDADAAFGARLERVAGGAYGQLLEVAAARVFGPRVPELVRRRTAPVAAREAVRAALVSTAPRSAGVGSHDGDQPSDEQLAAAVARVLAGDVELLPPTG